MRLYSIRDKNSGLFFLTREAGPRAKLVWSSSPIFWKTIDGIIANLRRIGGEINTRHRPVDSSAFDKRKLRHIEVVTTDVSVQGERSMPASAFFRVDARAALGDQQ